MNQRDKDRYKKRLLAKKIEIINQLSEIQNESKKIETGIAKDLGDKAESSYTKEFLLSLSNTERESLVLIDEALKRIEKSDFGLCTICQKNIGKKRLDAIPWAPYCISCQEKEEAEL